MNKIDISNAMRLQTEELAAFVEDSCKALSKTSCEEIYKFIDKRSFSNKHVFLEFPNEHRAKAILISLLYSSADPFTAQTFIMEAHVSLLESVCEKLNLSKSCLVPISTIEEKLLELF